MTLKQLSVFIPNKPGQLANFFELLMENKIYIRSMTVAETEDYGLLLLLVDQTEKCISILEENEILYSITNVIAIELSNNITELYKISKTLGANNINIEYLYFLVLDDHRNGVVLRLDDNENGLDILKRNDFQVID
ncbi:MAG: amino acid-binding protein [Candidatus Lokiarchaeota archaeon]|nr:amino acid-binding protein [Candidatus Lokiarchaeota archaeon]